MNANYIYIYIYTYIYRKRARASLLETLKASLSGRYPSMRYLKKEKVYQFSSPRITKQSVRSSTDGIITNTNKAYIYFFFFFFFFFIFSPGICAARSRKIHRGGRRIWSRCPQVCCCRTGNRSGCSRSTRGANSGPRCSRSAGYLWGRGRWSRSPPRQPPLLRWWSPGGKLNWREQGEWKNRIDFFSIPSTGRSRWARLVGGWCHRVSIVSIGEGELVTACVYIQLQDGWIVD